MTNGLPNGQPNGLYRLSNLTSFFLDDGWRVLNERPLFAFEDGVHGSEPWIVVNQPPVAEADSAVTARDVSVLVTPRANDSDPDSVSSIVAIAISAPPAHGTLVAEGAGFRYAPTVATAAPIASTISSRMNSARKARSRASPSP